jgi:hypothetical protein
MDNYRKFQAGPDPFGRMWDVTFQWLQTAISIRHADAVDVKFNIETADEPKQERVIALRHPDLLEITKKVDHPLTDAFCLKLAALHLKKMIETFEDMDKTLVTAPKDEVLAYAEILTAPVPETR